MPISLTRSLSVTAILIATMGTTACVPVWLPRNGGHGPPSHAPAHGHRAKHRHGSALEFDPGLGVYVVVGHPGFYFMHDHYYRMIDGYWHVAANVAGPWTVSSHEHVPPGLVKQHGKGRSEKNDKGKGKGKSKGRP